MTDLRHRPFATLSLAALLSLGVAATAQAYPVPPPFRGDIVREHEAEVRFMTLRDLERDIDTARSSIMTRQFDAARQSTEFALALANSLADADPAAIDPLERARLRDADSHIDSAVELLYRHEPGEARHELRTAQLEIELFAGQNLS